jgi:hypothetical protein
MALALGFAGIGTAKISDSPSGLSVKRHWEGVSFPSPMAMVETPAFKAGVPTFAPFLRAGFQTGVGFTMTARTAASACPLLPLPR